MCADVQPSSPSTVDNEYLKQKHVAATIQLLRAYVERPCAGGKGYAHARGIWTAYACNSLLDVQKTVQACILLHGAPEVVSSVTHAQVREAAVYFAAICVFYGAKPRVHLSASCAFLFERGETEELDVAVRCVRERAVFVPDGCSAEKDAVFAPQNPLNRNAKRRRNNNNSTNPAEARLKSAKQALKLAEAAVDMKAISAINTKSHLLLRQLNEAKKALEDSVGNNGDDVDNENKQRESSNSSNF